MNIEAKTLLLRWKALDQEEGLRRAISTARLLWFIGLVLCMVVVAGIVYKLHPAAVAVAAAVMGWVVAERNALQTRVVHWPILKRYIDWKRVQEDLSNDRDEA